MGVGELGHSGGLEQAEGSESGDGERAWVHHLLIVEVLNIQVIIIISLPSFQFTNYSLSNKS